MNNYLLVKDLVHFKLLDPKLVEIKDSFLSGNPIQTSNEPFSGKKGLIVRLAATHAGIVTGNNTFYLPDKMREGVPTFVENFGKPILTHHNEEKDPIGRVIDARYVDTSNTLKDSKWFGKEVRDSAGRLQGSINDKLISDLCDGKMPYGQAIDVVRNILDNSVLQDVNYEGLGYAEIIAQITDTDAIEKFLDGRYLTGSVSASTDKAVCSNCRQDWTKDGKCDHTPGSIVDGKKVYLIAGKFIYSEYSMVNKPADRHSKVLELYYNGIKDSIEIAKDSTNRIHEVNVGFPQFEVNDKVQEDDLMSVKNKETQTPVESTKIEVKDSTVQPIENKDQQVVVTPETPAEPKVEDVKQEPESFDALLTRILDTNYKLVAQDEEASYQKMLDEMKTLGVSDKEIEGYKLTPERRAKLSKSIFAGPERTFPIPDAAHAVAADSLLKNYKGTGNKDSMAVVVTRKFKAMYASKLADALKSTSKQIKDGYQSMSIMHQLLGIIEQNEYTAPEDTPPLSPEDISSIQALLKKLVGMIGKDNLAKAAGIEKLGLDAVVEKVLCDEITNLEVLVGTLRDEVSKITEEKNAIKEEYDILFNEMNALQDSVVELKTSSRKDKMAKLALLIDLKEGVVKDRNESFATLTDQVIDAQLVTLTTEVDMNKIVAKLNDGMSRTPTGEVINPSEVVQDTKSKKSVTAQEMSLIEENFTKLLLKDKIAAHRYLDGEMNRLRKEGKLPK